MLVTLAGPKSFTFKTFYFKFSYSVSYLSFSQSSYFYNLAYPTKLS